MPLPLYIPGFLTASASDQIQQDSATVDRMARQPMTLEDDQDIFPGQLTSRDAVTGRYAWKKRDFDSNLNRIDDDFGLSGTAADRPAIDPNGVAYTTPCEVWLKKTIMAGGSGPGLEIVAGLSAGFGVPVSSEAIGGGTILTMGVWQNVGVSADLLDGFYIVTLNVCAAYSLGAAEFGGASFIGRLNVRTGTAVLYGASKFVLAATSHNPTNPGAATNTYGGSAIYYVQATGAVTVDAQVQADFVAGATILPSVPVKMQSIMALKLRS